MTNTAHNIFLIGPMGSGKSTVGKQLASELNRNFLDTDQTIEARTGVNISWIFSVEGEEGFRTREKAIVRELTAMSQVVISTGGGTVVEKENRSLLANNGIVVYLQTSKEVQLSRTLRNRHNRPMLQVDDLEERIESLMESRSQLYEEIADISVATDGKSIRTVVTEILAKLPK